jgi:hypothetical protein
LTAKTGGCLQDRVRRRAKPIRAAHKAQDKGAKDSQPYLAQDAVPPSWRPCAAFQGFGKGEDSGSFVSIERPAVVASVGNEPGAAAKSVSHGDLLPSIGLGSREADSRSRSRKLACDLRENQRGKELPRYFLRGFPLIAARLPSRVFAFQGSRRTETRLFRPYNDSQPFAQACGNLAQALFTAVRLSRSELVIFFAVTKGCEIAIRTKMKHSYAAFALDSYVLTQHSYERSLGWITIERARIAMNLITIDI